VGRLYGHFCGQKHWITAKVEPSGATGKGKIYMNPDLRGLLNREVVGVPMARLGMSYPLHVRRAPSWLGQSAITEVNFGAKLVIKSICWILTRRLSFL